MCQLVVYALKTRWSQGDNFHGIWISAALFPASPSLFALARISHCPFLHFSSSTLPTSPLEFLTFAATIVSSTATTTPNLNTTMAPPSVPSVLHQYYKLRKRRSYLSRDVTQAKVKYNAAVHALTSLNVEIEKHHEEYNRVSRPRFSSPQYANDSQSHPQPVAAEPLDQEQSTNVQATEHLPTAIIRDLSVDAPPVDTPPIDTPPVAARPGLCTYNGPQRDTITSHNHVKSSKLDTLSVEYTMIVKLGEDWHEIWCHICGANGKLTPTGTAVHLSGVLGLTQHLAAKHAGLNAANSSADEKWTGADVLAACGKHCLSEQELRDLCEWKLTTNKVAIHGKPVDGAGTKRCSAPLSPLPYASSGMPSSSTMAHTSMPGKRQRTASYNTYIEGEDNIDVAPQVSESHAGAPKSSEKIRYIDESEDDI